MNKIILILLIKILYMNDVNGQTLLNQTIQKFTQALIDPEPEALNTLASEKLSYGHSNGVIENKQTFISSLISGKYNFLSIEITNQKIDIVDNIAIVRHDLFANTHDKDKPKGTVNLRVLMVWSCHNQGNWKLVARQAVKKI